MQFVVRPVPVCWILCSGARLVSYRYLWVLTHARKIQGVEEIPLTSPFFFSSFPSPSWAFWNSKKLKA